MGYSDFSPHQVVTVKPGGMKNEGTAGKGSRLCAKLREGAGRGAAGDGSAFSLLDRMSLLSFYSKYRPVEGLRGRDLRCDGYAWLRSSLFSPLLVGGGGVDPVLLGMSKPNSFLFTFY